MSTGNSKSCVRRTFGRADVFRKHLIQDLAPYVCIFDACASSRTVFGDKKTWIDHMQLEHAQAEFWSTKQCPLCNDTKADLERHALLIDIAKHLEEVSLLALPPDVDEDHTDLEDDEDELDKNSNSQVETSVGLTQASIIKAAGPSSISSTNSNDGGFATNTTNMLEEGKLDPRFARSRPQILLCSMCNDHPYGFRGEHELQRHINRSHSHSRKVWICVDSSADKKFLANCKACRQKKRYGAYYNAAAQ